LITECGMILRHLNFWCSQKTTALLKIRLSWQSPACQWQ